jgi:predicted RNA-binding Zn-ribbon protein involved in translation (DUF1610 family)
MRNIIKEIAIIIVALTLLIVGIIFIVAPDKAARERFGDGTCQSCGEAKYEQVTIDRNGCKVYECPKCDDSVRFGGH